MITVPVVDAVWVKPTVGLLYSKTSPLIFRSELLLVTPDPIRLPNLAPLSLMITPSLLPYKKISPEEERIS